MAVENLFFELTHTKRLDLTVSEGLTDEDIRTAVALRKYCHRVAELSPDKGSDAVLKRAAALLIAQQYFAAVLGVKELCKQTYKELYKSSGAEGIFRRGGHGEVKATWLFDENYVEPVLQLYAWNDNGRHTDPMAYLKLIGDNVEVGVTRQFAMFVESKPIVLQSIDYVPDIIDWCGDLYLKRKFSKLVGTLESSGVIGDMELGFAPASALSGGVCSNDEASKLVSIVEGIDQVVVYDHHKDKIRFYTPGAAVSGNVYWFASDELPGGDSAWQILTRYLEVLQNLK